MSHHLSFHSVFILLFLIPSLFVELLHFSRNPTLTFYTFSIFQNLYVIIQNLRDNPTFTYRIFLFHCALLLIFLDFTTNFRSLRLNSVLWITLFTQHTLLLFWSLWNTLIFTLFVKNNTFLLILSLRYTLFVTLFTFDAWLLIFSLRIIHAWTNFTFNTRLLLLSLRKTHIYRFLNSCWSSVMWSFRLLSLLRKYLIFWLLIVILKFSWTRSSGFRRSNL